MRERIGLCRKCDRLRVMKARRLCNSCYSIVSRGRRLDEYPPDPPVDEWSPVCTCADPIVERIPLFKTEQCARCGKPFLENLLRSSGHVAD